MKMMMLFTHYITIAIVHILYCCLLSFYRDASASPYHLLVDVMLHIISQQVQQDVSIEFIHLSTCVHDHTAPTCDQSLLDLHIEVKVQSEASIATITMVQQPKVIDCEPPVINQSSPVSLDTHIDQTNLHVQSPSSCAHYSHTAHATMHPDRDVPSRILF